MKSNDVLEQDTEIKDYKLLCLLLKDKSTKQNIKWATKDYSRFGKDYSPDREILPKLIFGNRTDLIQPRISKLEFDRVRRTKEKAEVFTPSWVCNIQNNLIDEAWFERENVFNTCINKTWTTNYTKIELPNEKEWQDYVKDIRLEVTCGEAPYLVSRYDSVTGKRINVEDRIGLLDRKLRIVTENTSSEEEWIKWAFTAYQSIYGYDFQGDNVLLARENLLFTFNDYLKNYFGHEADFKILYKLANIIVWNIWQMDGIDFSVPFSSREPEFEQIHFSFIESETPKSEPIPCRIYDWRANRSVEFREVMKV